MKAIQVTIYQDFDLEVFNINDLPEFVTSPVTNAAVGSKYEYWVEVSDDEDNQLTCEAIVKPEWLSFSFNPVTGLGLLQPILRFAVVEKPPSGNVLFTVLARTPST